MHRSRQSERIDSHVSSAMLADPSFAPVAAKIKLLSGRTAVGDREEIMLAAVSSTEPETIRRA